MPDMLCRRCSTPIPLEADPCPQCGWHSSKRASFVKIAAITVIAGVMAILAWLGWNRLGSIRPKAVTSRYVAEIMPALSGAAFSVRGVMTMDYQDLGDSIRLGISAQADPVVYVDVNQDGRVDVGDLRYATAGSRPCVQRLGPDEGAAVCDVSLSHATVRVERSADATTVTWVIPKSELQMGSDGADIAIQIFHEASQLGEFYPDEPFHNVYHLAFTPAVPLPAIHPTEQQAAPSPSEDGSNEETKEKQEPAEGAGPTSPAAQSAPTIQSFASSVDGTQPGGDVTLTWAVTPDASVQIEPDIGAVPAVGQRVIEVQHTTNYLLIAKGAGGISSRQLTVRVEALPAPQIESFVSDAEAAPSGGTAHLTWSVVGNASHVSINPGFDSLPPKGDRAVVVKETTDYTLSAEGPGGSAVAKVTIRATPLPPVITLEASPNNLHPGDVTTLRWNVTGADTINLYPGVGAVAAAGSIVLRPIRTIRYSMIAQGAGGNSERDETILVVRPSGPSSGQIVWTGQVHGLQLVTIDGNHADTGKIEGALPGLPCIVQPVDEKDVSIASSPGPRNNYTRLVLRVKGNGNRRVVLNWSLQ